MIISKLMGGQGNQMFQYAAGLALAQRHNTEFLVDINYLKDKSKRYFRHENRDYELNMFNLSAKLATDMQISKFTVPRQGNKYIYHLKKRIFREHNVFDAKDIVVPCHLLDLPGNSYLQGYFQNPGFFSNIKERVRAEFTFINPLPDCYQPILKEIQLNNSVCVHFRRGDFVNHPILDIIDLKFYYRAIELLAEKMDSPKLFIFSDDISWCQENFKPRKIRIEFVNQFLSGSDSEYHLQLMVACKHFIIPNSTFSWWGAWLSNSPGKIIIAPKKWHRNQIAEINPIIPSDWTTI